MQPQPSSSPRENSLMSSGYGYIPKSVMRMRGLSVTAKAIYAYLCSYSGRSAEAWPSVSLMASELGLGREGLRTHMKALEEAGLVAVLREKRAGKFAQNVYFLCGREASGAMRRQGEVPEAGLPEAAEPRMAHTGMDQPRAVNPAAALPRAAQPAAKNNRSSNNTAPNNTPRDDEEASAVLPPGRAGARERDREGIRREFRRNWGREALEAEVDALAGLLQVCDAEALAEILRKAGEHAPAAPACYARRIVEWCRSDAARHKLLRGPFEKLTAGVLARLEVLNGE